MSILYIHLLVFKTPLLFHLLLRLGYTIVFLLQLFNFLCPRSRFQMHLNSGYLSKVPVYVVVLLLPKNSVKALLNSRIITLLPKQLWYHHPLYIPLTSVLKTSSIKRVAFSLRSVLPLAFLFSSRYHLPCEIYIWMAKASVITTDLTLFPDIFRYFQSYLIFTYAWDTHSPLVTTALLPADS